MLEDEKIEEGRIKVLILNGTVYAIVVLSI